MDILKSLINGEETVWLNPDRRHIVPREKINGYGFARMKAAQMRFMRFLPWFELAFPETAAKKGLIESGLFEITNMKDRLNAEGAGVTGRVLLKDDAHLPVAGSVKARGGIHEVLAIAEKTAQQADLLWPTENYAKVYSDAFREFYSRYTIQVGSTGNLGISIGRTAARLGFQVIVHMSSDAKEWKKELLRSEGVTVIEYEGDYGEAVASGRRESLKDENSFFIDDENSEDLFFGYSTAAMRVSVQLRKMNIPVDSKHPLFLYLPCGVGGAPGGITFGFKQLYGDNVHCFFAEPVQAPCLTLGMVTGKGADICVQDIGLDGRTDADGLAVGRPSGFVCRMMKPLMSGSFTVFDERMADWQEKLRILEEINVELSACAGFKGLFEVENEGTAFEEYLKRERITETMEQATHIVWATGGGLMPDA